MFSAVEDFSRQEVLVLPTKGLLAGPIIGKKTEKKNLFRQFNGIACDSAYRLSWRQFSGIAKVRAGLLSMKNRNLKNGAR